MWKMGNRTEGKIFFLYSFALLKSYNIFRLYLKIFMEGKNDIAINASYLSFVAFLA